VIRHVAFTLTCLVALVAAVGCGGAGNRELAPLLPGDGTDNTAPPPAGPTRPATDDPWAEAELIDEPTPQPPRAVKLPPVKRFTLKNGLEVMVVESSTVPVASMQLAIKTGEIDQPRDKVGVAAFTAEMLTKGTRRRTAAQIAESVEFVGGSLSAASTNESTFLSCSALAKDLDTCLALLPELMTQPTFPAAEMDTVRDRLLAAVRQRKDSAGALASAHFVNLLWGEDHPRGWPMSGRTIASIGRDDLIQWHRRWFVPNNAVLAIAGDVNADDLRAKLERGFRTWRRGKVARNKDSTKPELRGLKVRVVDMPKQTQSHIRVGHFGVARGDADYLDMLVMNYSFGGGGFSSRLMKVVRSEGGKTYGASSSFDRDNRPGAFVAQTFTRTGETAATLKLVLTELARMATGGPSEKEVADAKAAIAGSYATRFGSANAIASALLDADLHGFNQEFVKTFALRVAEVSLESARAAAKDRLDPTNLAIVIVGNASEIVPQLEAAGLPAPEVLSHLDPIARYEREAPPIDPATAKQARALLDRALKAKGGAAKLQGVKSIRFEGDAELSQGGQTQSAKQTRLWASPGKVRIDVTLAAMGVQISLAATDAGGWVRQAVGTRSQVADLPADRVAGQLWRNGEMMLLRHRQTDAVVGLLDDETVDGVTYKVVYLADGDGKHPSKLYIHPKTFLLERLSYTEQGIDNLEVFSDFKRVQGIQIAHQRDTLGQQSSKFSVKTITINGSIPDDAFDRPAN